MITPGLSTARRRIQLGIAGARDWAVFLATFAAAYLLSAVVIGVHVGITVSIAKVVMR